jgi:hypothetical protein
MPLTTTDEGYGVAAPMSPEAGFVIGPVFANDWV